MNHRALLMASLEHLAGSEAKIVERFYPLFFARRPEVRELFGENGISEREEMVRETFVSALAYLEEEPWLDENLHAMGKSHAEYGVEGPMYAWFVDTLLDTLEEVAGANWGPKDREAWSEVLTELASRMQRGACTVDA